MACVTVNPNCILIVPPLPLSAAGLATPYYLTSADPAMPCNQANTCQSAFVQGAVLNLDTGAMFNYDPLVIDLGTTPGTFWLMAHRDWFFVFRVSDSAPASDD
jgi:hypothetical protein